MTACPLLVVQLSALLRSSGEPSRECMDCGESQTPHSQKPPSRKSRHCHQISKEGVKVENRVRLLFFFCSFLRMRQIACLRECLHEAQITDSNT